MFNKSVDWKTFLELKVSGRIRTSLWNPIIIEINSIVKALDW